MDKKKNICLVVLLYGILAAACLFLLLIMSHMAAPPPGQGTDALESSRESEEQESSQETTGQGNGTGETTEAFVEGLESGETEAEPPAGREKSLWDRKKKAEKKAGENNTGPQLTPVIEVKRPPKVIFASDLHYYPSEMTDYGEAFQKMVKKDDGKAIPYISSLLEAFYDEVIREMPSALVLSGDLTLNGERAGHEELAQRLKRVEEAGVKVLVIPGNHDINNHDASAYFGDKREAAESVDEEGFYQIYRTYGYDQAVSRDPASLSYVYALDDENWLMMLDSCIYEPYNMVGGRIRDTTLAWMEELLQEAGEAGISVLPVAHHNLLKESILYPTDCVLENSAQVIGLLEKYRLPLYMSGHLHLQRTKRYRAEPGEPEDTYHISEIVSDSVAIPPCRYGILTWAEDEGLSYETRNLDVDAWTREKGVDELKLLDFPEFGESFLYEIISEQIYRKMSNLPKEQMRAMAGLYAELNSAYCAGRAVAADEVRSSEAYRLWERNLPDSQMFKDLNKILKDTKEDHNTWSYEPPVEEDGETAAADGMEIEEAAAGGMETEVSVTGRMETDVSVTSGIVTDESATGGMETDVSATGGMETEVSATGRMKTEETATGGMMTEEAATGGAAAEENAAEEAAKTELAAEETVEGRMKESEIAASGPPAAW